MRKRLYERMVAFEVSVRALDPDWKETAVDNSTINMGKSKAFEGYNSVKSSRDMGKRLL